MQPHDMQRKIGTELAGEEVFIFMKPLFSCLYGSHLFGTSTPESDRDVKTVVLWNLDELLLGRKVQNIVKKTNTQKFKKNSPDDIDQEFIPLQVFALHFMEGQNYALELAHAMDSTHAEQKIYDPRFVTFCQELRERFMTSETHTIARFAVNQAELYSEKAERLNAAHAVRDLYASFPQGDKVQAHAEVFAEKARLVEAEFPNTLRLTEYDASGQGLMKPCVQTMDRILPHSASFKFNLQTIDAVIRNYGDRTKRAAKNQGDWKATMHAVRIVEQGISLLSGHGLRFPHDSDSVARLLSIRRGERTYEEVMKDLKARLETLQTLSENSTRPKNTPELRAELNTWLLGWLHQFYGIG